MSDIGKDFENDTSYSLDILKSKGFLGYVRLYDTHSARGKFLPTQPADFIIGSKAVGGCLLECKASEVHYTLSSCVSANVDEGQAGAMALWMRAGNKGLYLFHDVLGGLVELWDGAKVTEAKATGIKLKKNGYIAVEEFHNLTEFLEYHLVQHGEKDEHRILY